VSEQRIIEAPALREVADDGREDWAGDVVPPGHLVASGYVPVDQVVCRVDSAHQLYPAEVERAYKRQLELEDRQAWPPPSGHWRTDGRFVLTDGRNRYVAALMLGVQHLLVAWLVPHGSDR